MKNKSLCIERKQSDYRKVLFALPGILIVLVLVCYHYSCTSQQAKAGSDEKSVAVIPVSNNICDPELEYLSTGMHDALVSELGNINSLLVKSKSASLKYMNSELSLQQIADELGVNEIVRTSLECSEFGTRMLVELIEVSPDEKVIWSGTYDQDLENVLTIYRDISRQIARKIKVDLTPQEKARLNAARPVNAELYKAYTQGMFYMNKLTPEGVKQGLKYLNDAIAIDPTDPLPYLGLALGYSNAGHNTDAPADAPRLAKEYALKALELDSTLAEPYIILASDYIYEEWNFPAAEQALKRSIQLNPNVALAHYHLAWYLAIIGQFDEAEKEMKKAIEIDPLDPMWVGAGLATLYIWAGRWEEAIPAALKTLELDSSFPMGYWALGCAYAELGRFDEAIETHKKGIAISLAFKHGLGVAYALAGRREEAFSIASELEKLNNPWYTWGLAEIYAALGDKDKTIQWVEAAYEQRHEFVVGFQTDASLKIVYDDPRFQEIMNRLNLPV